MIQKLLKWLKHDRATGRDSLDRLVRCPTDDEVNVWREAPDGQYGASNGYISESPLNQKRRSRSDLIKKNRACFKSAHVEWGTPPDLYAALDKEFHFTLDPCAVGQVWDGREISWAGHRVFCNPPYSAGKRNKIEPWLAKAREAECAVYLLPSRTGTAWFHNYALNADEIRFFRGRLRFYENHRIGPDDHIGCPAPFDSLLLVFHTGAVAPATQKYNDRTHARREQL